jgi:hypothetical protein
VPVVRPERRPTRAADRNLARLGLLGERDAQRQHTVAVVGLDAVDREAVAEDELPAEHTRGALRHHVGRALRVVAAPLGPHGQRVVFRRHVERLGVDAGKVEAHDEPVTHPQAVHRHRRGRARGAEHLAGEPVEVAERIETQQHDQHTSKISARA